MPTIVKNTPTLLIPKELYKEEKIQEYWNVLHPTSQHENIGIDFTENFYLLYPKPKYEDTIHEISAMYQDFTEKFSDKENAVCVNVYENDFSLLVIKNKTIEYTGYFQYTVNEDVLYHFTNVFQHFFENNPHVVFAYQQILPEILRLLNNYYEMKQI